MDGVPIRESPVALTIMLLTVVTSLLAFQSEDLYRRFVLHPYSLVREQRFYTLFTSGFIHADLTHLFFNMVTFYFFAFGLERQIGDVQFLALYVFSLALSDITTVVKHRNNPEYYCLGASGAVTAVLFSSIIYNPAGSIFIIPIPVPIPAPVFAVLYVGYSYYSARYRETHVNHAAHLWGAISGLALTLLLDPQAYRHLFNALFH